MRSLIRKCIVFCVALLMLLSNISLGAGAGNSATFNSDDDDIYNVYLKCEKIKDKFSSDTWQSVEKCLREYESYKDKPMTLKMRDQIMRNFNKAADNLYLIPNGDKFIFDDGITSTIGMFFEDLRNEARWTKCDEFSDEKDFTKNIDLTHLKTNFSISSFENNREIGLIIGYVEVYPNPYMYNGSMKTMPGVTLISSYNPDPVKLKEYNDSLKNNSNSNNDNTTTNNNSQGNNTTTTIDNSEDEGEEEEEDITETKKYKNAEHWLKIFKNNYEDEALYEKAKEKIKLLDDCNERDDLLDELKKYKKKMDKSNNKNVSNSEGFTTKEILEKNIYANNPKGCWRKDDMGRWMYFNNNGVMLTGMQNINGKYYYFNIVGQLQTGWIQEKNDKWYYFGNDGAMLKNTYVNGYYLGSDGAWIK